MPKHHKDHEFYSIHPCSTYWEIGEVFQLGDDTVDLSLFTYTKASGMPVPAMSGRVLVLRQGYDLWEAYEPITRT